MDAADISSPAAMAPFRIAPTFVTRVWGYQDLRPWYDRQAQGEPIGEVWLTGDDCKADTGDHTGKTLGDLFAAYSKSLLGASASSPQSPLLLKVIFAKQKLSVQVHPDDKMAQKYGQPRGKTECWFALAAEPAAEVAVGLKPEVTLDEIKDGIHSGTLESSLKMLPVEPGDMILVEAGTVHAIWPGSILLETQQNCDLTYRMYDYGRPRELHIDKSLEAVKLDAHSGKVRPIELADRTILVDAQYFRVERIPIAGTRASDTLAAPGQPSQRLSYLFAASGSATVAGPGFDPIDLPPRGIVAVPASAPPFLVEDRGGLDLIRISPNQL
jgi:mannose-6-phosphate isomerase